MRMSRVYSGKEKVLKFEGAFHGNHDYASVSVFPKERAHYPVGKANYNGVPTNVPENMLIAPYNDLEAVEAIVAEHLDDLAAMIVEPIQRIVFPQPGFLQGLREICDKYGIILIFDEVVTGFRLALGGAQEYFGVTPDLATYAKIISGGGAMGCVAGKAEIIEMANARNKGKANYAYVSGTLHGNPMGAAVGLAVISELEKPGFYSSLHARGDDLITRLQSVLYRHEIPAIVAGGGSLWQILFLESPPVNALDLVNSNKDAMRRLDKELLRRGIYVLPGVRRFVCDANTEEDFELTVAALHEACEVVA